jgi:hypothetical protein
MRVLAVRDTRAQVVGKPLLNGPTHAAAWGNMLLRVTAGALIVYQHGPHTRYGLMAYERYGKSWRFT